MVDLKIVLASKSPRRQDLIKELGIPFEIRTKEVEEIYPEALENAMVPEFLAKLKATPLLDSLHENEVLLTSDTIVIHNDKILGKPKNQDDAFQMLSSLSNDMHEVITGVCLNSTTKSYSFSTSTKVYFSELSMDNITYYIEKFKPFDKAGAYGLMKSFGG